MRTRATAIAIARAVAKSESTSDPKLKTHSQNQRLMPSLKWMVGVYVSCRLHIHTMGSSLQSFSLKLVKGCGASKMFNEKLIPKQLTSPCFQFDCLSLLLFPSLSRSFSLTHSPDPCTIAKSRKTNYRFNECATIKQQRAADSAITFFFRKYDKSKIVASIFFSFSLFCSLCIFSMLVNKFEWFSFSYKKSAIYLTTGMPI